MSFFARCLPDRPAPARGGRHRPGRTASEKAAAARVSAAHASLASQRRGRADARRHRHRQSALVRRHGLVPSRPEPLQPKMARRAHGPRPRRRHQQARVHRSRTELFDRLDRDRDGRLTATDFDWSEAAPINRQMRIVHPLLPPGRRGPQREDHLRRNGRVCSSRPPAARIRSAARNCTPCCSRRRLRRRRIRWRTCLRR